MTRTPSLLLCTGALLLLSSSPIFAHGPDQAFELDARIVLGAYEGLVDEHLVGVLSGLKALAATQDATSGDWERLKGPLEQFGKSVSTNAAIWYAKPDGSYFTVEEGRAEQTLSGRDYFPGLIQGEDVIGSLVVSKSTGMRSVIVATPIVKDGHVMGALGVSISAAKLAELVADKIRLPSDVIFYALDAHGLTALHKETSLIFQFPSDLGDDSLKSAVQQMLSQPEGKVEYVFRGAHRSVLYRRSKSTGWVFALGIIRAG